MGGVLYIPLLKKNMFSIGHVADKGIITTQKKIKKLHYQNSNGKGEVIMTRVRT